MNIVLTFENFYDTSIPSKHAISYRFIFSYVDESTIGLPEEDFETKETSINVEISETKQANWNLYNDQLVKVLFEYGKRELIQKFKDRTFLKQNELHIYTNTHPGSICPFDPNKIKMEKGNKYKIEIPEKTLSEEVNYNKVAFSIISKRDEINALFNDKFNDKLLTLNQERSLLELFRPALTQEEFSYRVTALGNLVGNLNKEVLSNLSNLDPKKHGSINLIEDFLNKYDNNQNISLVFKNLNKLRQGYPVHGDNVDGVIQAYNFFKIYYPINDFNKAWITLINAYNESLISLFGLISKIDENKS